MKLEQELTFSGTVEHGEKVGRTIGFPTANLQLDGQELTIRPGVYFGTCEVKGKQHHCLPYFGPRLVFGETKNVFEVFIYDFEEEIYGELVSVTLSHFLRPPLALNSLEELQAQLKKDQAAGRKLEDSSK